MRLSYILGFGLIYFVLHSSGWVCAQSPSPARANTIGQYSVEVIEPCSNQSEDPDSAFFTILYGERNLLGGWSHIRRAKENGEYLSLALEDEYYQVGPAHYAPDPTCNDEKTFRSVLVLKYSDWERQHSNGLESSFSDPRLTLGNIEKIELELKINSQHTRIPSRQTLRAKYSAYLTEEQWREFDNGKVHLGVSIWEAGALNQETPSLTGEVFVEIDQHQYFDQWLRIRLPTERMNYFIEQSYEATPVDPTAFQNLLIEGLRINPENSHGNQLRNFLQDQWRADIGETFKEIDISIRKIVVVLRNPAISVR